ncbi:MAG: hypothetical protein AAF658_03680 [Myxococcota bacterium]
MLLVFAHALSLAASDPLIDRYEQIFLAPLSSLGSTEEELQAIERVLYEELRRFVPDSLRREEALLATSEAASDAYQECERVADCVVEVLAALGWDGLIVGNVAGLGGDKAITLKLYDLRSGGELRRASATLSGDEAQLIRSMREAAATLVAPAQLKGTLAFTVSQPGVQVFLDGELVGTAPLEDSRVDVPIGRHAVEGRGDGLVSYSSFVDVGYGEVAPVEVVLATNSLVLGAGTPYRNRWWPWTIAGVGALSLGVGGYFNAEQAASADELEERFGAGSLDAGARDLIEQERSDWRTARAFYAAGATLVATTLVLFALDLLED